MLINATRSHITLFAWADASYNDQDLCISHFGAAMHKVFERHETAIVVGRCPVKRSRLKVIHNTEMTALVFLRKDFDV